jgi:hypothetical protein
LAARSAESEPDITTAMRNTPCTTDCQWALRLIQPYPFSKLSTLKINPSSRTLAKVVPTGPTSPVSRVPPTTTAAIQNNSRPTTAMIALEMAISRLRPLLEETSETMRARHTNLE